MPAAFAEPAAPSVTVAPTAERFAVEAPAVDMAPVSAPLHVEVAAAEAVAPTPAEIAAPVAAEAVAPAPVAVQPAPQPVVAAEPVVAAVDPIIVPPAPQPAVVDVKESLQQVGLVMIETSHAAPATNGFAPAQPLGVFEEGAAIGGAAANGGNQARLR